MPRSCFSCSLLLAMDFLRTAIWCTKLPEMSPPLTDFKSMEPSVRRLRLRELLFVPPGLLVLHSSSSSSSMPHQDRRKREVPDLCFRSVEKVILFDPALPGVADVPNLSVCRNSLFLPRSDGLFGLKGLRGLRGLLWRAIPSGLSLPILTLASDDFGLIMFDKLFRRTVFLLLFREKRILRGFIVLGDFSITTDRPWGLMPSPRLEC